MIFLPEGLDPVYSEDKRTYWLENEEGQRITPIISVRTGVPEPETEDFLGITSLASGEPLSLDPNAPTAWETTK